MDISRRESLLKESQPEGGPAAETAYSKSRIETVIGLLSGVASRSEPLSEHQLALLGQLEDTFGDPPSQEEVN